MRGIVRRLLLQYIRPQPVESRRLVLHSGDRSGGVGFADGASSPMLRHQHLAGGLGLQQFLLQFREGIAQRFGFCSLILKLLRKAVG